MSSANMPMIAYLLALAAMSAALTALLIFVLRPFLARYAIAQPNARSSHVAPTPQGGGIAVIGASVLVIAGTLLFSPEMFAEPERLALTFAAALGLAIVGITDDVRPLQALPRLILQAVAVAVVVATLPETLRIVPAMPWWLERAMLLIGGVWFVNLVNFMDGIDWMTVAEVVPVSAGLAIFGLLGVLPFGPAAVAAVLCGATLGFAPFNRPVARLFLGDVGSLPLGLLLGWLLVLLAAGGHLAAAALLPLYYLADTTITLVRRALRGEPIAQAHRTHFYQRAVINGSSVINVVAKVFVVNIVLAALAITTLYVPTAVEVILFICGLLIAVGLLWRLGRSL